MSIPFDLDCANCGYNLHGLPFEGQCPECGRSVGSTIEQHVRNRPRAKFDSAPLSERPVIWITHLTHAAWAGLIANLLGGCGFFLNEWALRRFSLQRTIVLGLLCLAITLAAYSIWKLANAAGVRFRWMRLLLRIGAVATVAFPLAVTLEQDYRTFDLPGAIRTGLRWASVGLIVGVAIGGVLRIAYMQWWLRIEGFSLFAWPLVLSSLPLALMYILLAFEGPRIMDRYSDFNSLNNFIMVPLPTNSWPGELPAMYYEITRGRLRFNLETFLVLLAYVAQALVILADVAMVHVATRAKRKRVERTEIVSSVARSSAASLQT